MTLQEAKQLKTGQQIYYKGLDILPIKVIVSTVVYNSDNKLEIYLVDNCYVPERDLDYVFLTFDECAKACEKEYKIRLNKLREMEKLNQ